MLGFLIGTVCLIGLVKTLRYGRHGCGGGGYWSHGRFGGGGHGGWGGPWAGRGPWGGHREHGGFGRGGFVLRAVLEHIDATPAQEKVLATAFDELRESGRAARREIKGSRTEIAKAMRAPGFDEVLLGELFAKHDTAIEALRRAAVGALAKTHDALDEKQRERLAELIESGPRAFRRGRGFNGPYRGDAYSDSHGYDF